MTGHSGNRLPICALRFRIVSPKFLLTSAALQSIETLGEAILNLSGVSIDQGAAEVNRNFGEAILNLKGQIDLPITFETSHYLFNILHCLVL